MKLWWFSDSVRLAAERAAVEQLGTEQPWFELARWTIDAARLAAEGTIIAHGVSYPVRLVYPDQFPSVPAWVQPQDSEAKWSVHQYGKGGTLCLELRPDNWVPDATGADVLRSAYNLLRTENPEGEGQHDRVPSAHAVGAVQSYDWEREPVLIGAGCLARVHERTAEDVRALRWMADDKVWPILVHDAVDRSTAMRPPPADIGTWRVELPVLIAYTDMPDLKTTDRAALGDALSIDLEPGRFPGAVVVLAVSTTTAIPYHSMADDSAFQRKLIVLPDRPGARSGRRPAARDKSVALVGTGSVGSKMAEMLVRSGVDRLVLVDGDVFLPENLERHVLDWRDVGFRKASALKRRLLHIMPGAAIEVIANNLNWQRSARIHASDISEIANCSVIVDATGDPPTALLLGAIAADNERPFVSVQVFEGGIGALVARSIPGRDPSYVTGRMRYQAYCDEQNTPPPPPAPRRYEAFDDGGEPIIADDAAVSIAAAHGARVILDVLDELVDDDATAWLLLGCRRAWLFTGGHGDVIRLDVGRPDAPDRGPENPEALAFALDLARSVLDANSSSA